MNGRIFFALGGFLLVTGAVLSQASNPVEDINRLDKARQEEIINELIKAQEQIQRALKRILKDSVPVTEQGQPGLDSEEADGSEETDEEHEWQEMKRKKIAEARGKVEVKVRGIASSFIGMGDLIDKIDKKVDEQLVSQGNNVKYNLYYKKPKPAHHSSEESGERYHYKKRPSRRGGRQLDVVAEPEEATVEEQPEVVKTVEGEEVVQTLPVAGSE